MSLFHGPLLRRDDFEIPFPLLDRIRLNAGIKCRKPAASLRGQAK